MSKTRAIVDFLLTCLAISALFHGIRTVNLPALFFSVIFFWVLIYPTEAEVMKVSSNYKKIRELLLENLSKTKEKQTKLETEMFRLDNRVRKRHSRLREEINKKLKKK